MKRCLSIFLVSLLLFSMSVNISRAQDEILFRRHIISSGWHGLYYGIALDIVAEIDGAAAAGLPIITAGTSALLPLFTNPSKDINYNGLILGGHGKTMGWAHGFALSTLISGEKAWWGDDYSSDNYKLTVGLGAVTSIGLGILGNSIGRKSTWNDGLSSLYSHYGWVMPYTGFSIMAAFSEEARLFGGSVLLFGAGGYFLANQVNRWNEFTRGEVRATQVLSLLNLGLGWGIFTDLVTDEWEDFNRTEWLIPAVGLLAGTFAGHLWLKNTNLTPQQGMLTAYASSGGAIIGLGIALITESEEPTPYYLIPYATGLAAYGLTVEMLRKRNATASLPVDKKSNWDVAFMPQNLFLNSRLQEKGCFFNGHYVGMQPLFAASLKF